MSEDVQLEQVVVNGMIVKMGRHRLGRHIVCRTLHRRKLINLMPDRQYDNAARMLSGGTPYADTAGGNPLYLRLPHRDSMLLVVF